MNESAPLPSMVDDQGSSWKLLAHETEQIVVSMAHDLGAYEVYDFSEYDNICFMRCELSRSVCSESLITAEYAENCMTSLE